MKLTLLGQKTGFFPPDNSDVNGPRAAAANETMVRGFLHSLSPEKSGPDMNCGLSTLQPGKLPKLSLNWECFHSSFRKRTHSVIVTPSLCYYLQS